jgi:ABC-type branched-subunit amino acid transport system substrate-binding protein
MSNALPAAREYRALLARYGNGAEPSYTSFEEFLAAKTLVEGLKRAKAPTRAALIAALESLEKLDLGGYTVSFGPNNRRGSKLVDIVTISKDGKVIH